MKLPNELPELERFELHEPPVWLFPASRREFLQWTAAGLLILVLPEEAPGQDTGTTLEGRLRIGTDGRITVLTGKIEEGQGARTQLVMAAAEELRLPVSAVGISMADTDLTPNDGITAGSRTTPSTVPQVRRAAATARELLIDTAAQQWGAARETVRFREAGVVDASGAKKLSYGELARSGGRPVPSGADLTTAKEWKVFGTPHHRTNGSDIVTGAHRFPSDIQRPGMLYASVLRPPSYGATLAAVDFDAARKTEGVTVVRDGEFVACAAGTSFAARRAVHALAATAKWREKPHPSSRRLFEHLKQNAEPGGRGRNTTKGDVDKALAGARQRLKATYTAAYIAHAPMEPRAAVAEWQDGKLTVWTGTSNPFAVREQLAQAFQMPANRVRVIVPDMGGGFGGKHTGEAAIEAARLAREAGRPVSLRWSREEEFMWAYCRPAALIEVEAALDQSNGIAAWKFINFNSGASAIDTPYRSATARIRYIPSDSPLRQGSYRALASTANNFAREAFLDELAAAAGADPLEFRLAHLENDRIRTVLLATAEKFGWKERSRRRQPNRGIGLACGTEKNSVVAACVEVEVDPRSGAPKLLEICEAYECGAILNPVNLRAQVEGCIVMGLGAVLGEALAFENGKLTNGRFSAYRVPRFRDLPKMEIVLVDKKEAEPVGAGETPIIAVAPAMANAVFAATGKRIRSLPFRPA